MSKKIHITGRVIDRKTRCGIAGLRIEAWDKDLICNDLVGSAVTRDEEGTFGMEFDESYLQELFQDRHLDLFFKVFHEKELIKSTEDSVLWNVETGETNIIIEVDVPAAEQPVRWLKINSFDELIQHEPEILERIADTPNGGNLFMAHPFMLLADIGVELSDQAREEIKRHEPYLSALSATPYNALKISKEEQRIRFHVHGLFQRRSQ